MILVQTAVDSAEVAPSLSGEDCKVMDRVEERWGDLCRSIGDGYDIPDGWLQAHIFQESGGNPDARNREGTPELGDDGIGLLQITHPSLKGRHRVKIDGVTKWLGGLTDSQLAVPATNVGIGARYIREKILVYGKDFPKIAAAFNHGHVEESNANPWGMVSTGPHISREVAALNYWIIHWGKPRQATFADSSGEPTRLIDLTDFARHVDDMARRELA